MGERTGEIYGRGGGRVIPHFCEDCDHDPMSSLGRRQVAEVINGGIAGDGVLLHGVHQHENRRELDRVRGQNSYRWVRHGNSLERSARE